MSFPSGCHRHAPAPATASPTAAPEPGEEGCRLWVPSQETARQLCPTWLSRRNGTLHALCLRFGRDKAAQGARLWARPVLVTGPRPGVWVSLLSPCRVLGSFWVPSTAVPQGLLLSPASLGRMRQWPLPLGEALAAGLASLLQHLQEPGRGQQEVGLGSWLLLLTDLAVFTMIPSFCPESQCCGRRAPGPPVHPPRPCVCGGALPGATHRASPVDCTMTALWGPMFLSGSC